MGNSIFYVEGRIDRFSYFWSCVIIAIYLGMLMVVIGIFLVMLNELFNIDIDSPDVDLFIRYNPLYIPFYWCLFAQGARRSHDLGNSGWLQLIPFYFILLLITPGDKLENKYGKPCYR